MTNPLPPPPPNQPLQGQDSNTVIWNWVDWFYRTAQLVTAAVTNTQSGVYTPTLTPLANVSSSTPYECTWTQVGNIVTVYGAAEGVSTVTKVLTQVGISLPIATTFTASTQASGVCNNNGDPVLEVGRIYADTSYVIMEFEAQKTTPPDVLSFTFSYVVS